MVDGMACVVEIAVSDWEGEDEAFGVLRCQFSDLVVVIQICWST